MKKDKPEPLDLEELENWIDKKEEEIYEKEGDIDADYFNEQIIKEIKKRIKSACEFYLRYKDMPELLIKEHPEYEEELDKMVEEYTPLLLTKSKLLFLLFGSVFINEYNEWLFKLAFKGIFKEVENEKN